MKILFEHKSPKAPYLSIVLLDWSCRDSFHTLDYLNDQTSPRRDYEIIWVEFYNKSPSQIEDKLNKSQDNGRHPILDQWMVMDVPQDIYYHKHLMYNVGLLAGRGEIVCFCDSDAVVRPTFIESIVKTFAKDSNIVLHMDQVRNKNKRLYPFQYPSIEEILSEGCINYKDGKTVGLIDGTDTLHTRNYGACMSARKADLINIGGADQHTSYLGHICGPYELTFRLMNAGRKEVWHQEEFLYHTWHPGSDGHNNYLGPHDGKNMSTTALDILASGRILPLVENPAIKMLRSQQGKIPRDILLSQAISESETKTWKIGKIRWAYYKSASYTKRFFTKIIKLAKVFLKISVEAVLYVYLFWIGLRQLFFKGARGAENKAMPKSFFFKFRLVFIFWGRMWKNNLYALGVGKEIIRGLKGTGTKQIAIYGANDLTKVLYLLAMEERLKVLSLGNLGSDGKVIIASFVRLKDKVKELSDLGILRKNIILLQ